MRNPSLMLLLVPLLASACSSYGGLAKNPQAVQVVTELPEPDVANTIPQPRPYLIGPFDSISIEVFGASELNRQGMVDAAGNFSMPLVGEVGVAGKTTTEVSQIIAERLTGQYIRRPQVSVQLVEARSQQVTVDGSVRQPGVYPVLGRTTLQKAIAMARGTDEFAKLKQVVVFREVGGQRMAALFNLKSIREGAMADPEIFGNDVIIVGEDLARRVFKDAIQTLPAFGVFTLIK